MFLFNGQRSFVSPHAHMMVTLTTLYSKQSHTFSIDEFAIQLQGEKKIRDMQKLIENYL